MYSSTLAEPLSGSGLDAACEFTCSDRPGDAQVSGVVSEATTTPATPAATPETPATRESANETSDPLEFPPVLATKEPPTARATFTPWPMSCSHGDRVAPTIADRARGAGDAARAAAEAQFRSRVRRRAKFRTRRATISVVGSAFANSTPMSESVKSRVSVSTPSSTLRSSRRNFVSRDTVVVPFVLSVSKPNGLSVSKPNVLSVSKPNVLSFSTGFNENAARAASR